MNEAFNFSSDDDFVDTWTFTNNYVYVTMMSTLLFPFLLEKKYVPTAWRVVDIATVGLVGTTAAAVFIFWMVSSDKDFRGTRGYRAEESVFSLFVVNNSFFGGYVIVFVAEAFLLPKYAFLVFEYFPILVPTLVLQIAYVALWFVDFRRRVIFVKIFQAGWVAGASSTYLSAILFKRREMRALN